MNDRTVGQTLEPLLIIIEDILWEHEYKVGSKPEYTEDGFRAATKIFMSALADKVYELQEKENISFDDKCKMIETAGNKLRELIKTFTDIDTHTLYDN